jgi:selenocysteine lyase/cysteine desulfurase
VTITRPDWRAIRAEFPALARVTHLDTARAAPLPRRAAEEAQRFYAEMLESGDLPRAVWLAQVEQVRARVAGWIGAPAPDVIFAASVADARRRLAPTADEVVDASAFLGAVALDVSSERCDALVSSGCNWLMAGHGIALGWSRRRRAAGSPGADEPALFPGIFALGASLELLEEIGASAIESRLNDLTVYLQRALAAAGIVGVEPAMGRAGVATTIVPWPEAPRAAGLLAAAGIVVSDAGESLRVSVHVFNNELDLDRLTAALEALRRGEPVAVPREIASPLVCVDLNGVLDSYEGWRGAEHWDPPAPGARAFLEALRDQGCRVVVFTTRHYLGVWRWLQEHGLAHLVHDVTNRKPAADVFVDDRAVCFRGDFDAALQQIAGFKAHWERQ